MTSTNICVGFVENEKTSSKILKPPGGGCSDIFNTSNGTGDPPPRVKNYMKSSIFEAGSSPSLSSAAGAPTPKYGTHHHSNIFGNGQAEPQKPRKVNNYMKSNIFAEAEMENGVEKQNGNYNPITGEAHETNGCVSDEKDSAAPCIRIRNPPGGHSTKLW